MTVKVQPLSLLSSFTRPERFSVREGCVLNVIISSSIIIYNRMYLMQYEKLVRVEVLVAECLKYRSRKFRSNWFQFNVLSFVESPVGILVWPGYHSYPRLTQVPIYNTHRQTESERERDTHTHTPSHTYTQTHTQTNPYTHKPTHTQTHRQHPYHPVQSIHILAASITLNFIYLFMTVYSTIISESCRR